MSAVRHRLPWIAGLWIVLQIAGVAAAPLAFCCQRADVAGDEECCPGLAPGQICPMHHVRKGDKKAEPPCKMRDACGRADAGLVSLAGVVGLLPHATAAVSRFEVGDAVDAATPSTISQAFRPESPPPRA